MRRRLAYGLAVILSVASLGAGAAGGPNSSEAGIARSGPIVINQVGPAQNKHQIPPYQVGIASWYGSYFVGRPTASGEPYDMYDFTAAHPTLRLGTFVRVTNLRNGRAIIVRINDRGPVVDGRIIDVSYNAATALDFKSRGIQKVRLDLVSNPTLALARPARLP